MHQSPQHRGCRQGGEKKSDGSFHDVCYLRLASVVRAMTKREAGT
jgi:hypothetical protein